MSLQASSDLDTESNFPLTTWGGGSPEGSPERGRGTRGLPGPGGPCLAFPVQKRPPEFWVRKYSPVINTSPWPLEFSPVPRVDPCTSSARPRSGRALATVSLQGEDHPASPPASPPIPLRPRLPFPCRV